MKLLTLTINNFLSFVEAKIALDEKGLVAVQGENLDGNGADSNGSGKSSLFMAIRWCLYGTSDKKMSADEIINSNTGKNCSVETLWLDEETNLQYRITRFRKHTKHKNKLRLEILHPGNPWLDTTKGKNDLTQIEVNKAIGMDDNVFVASCFASQEEPIDIPALGDKELKSLLENALPLAKVEPVYLKHKATLDKLTKQHEAVLASITNIQYQLTAHSNTYDELVEQEKVLLSNQVRQKEAGTLKLKAILAERQRLLDLDKDLESLRASRDALEARYKAIGLSDGAIFAVRLKGSKMALEELLKREIIGDSCPTCEQPMPSDKQETHQTDFDMRKALYENEIETYTKRIEEIRTDAPEAKRIEQEIADVDVEIYEVLKNRREAERLAEQARSEGLNLKGLSTNPLEVSINALQEKMKVLQLTKDGEQAKLKALEPDIRIYSALVETLSPKGFRYHLLESVTPTLNKATNNYLSMLTDGKISAVWSTVSKLGSGEYREAFSIKVNMNGRTNFGNLSGGQKRKVRLACWFALQDMIAQQAQKDVKLWVCDEVDTALDKAGIERLMSLLEEKARTKETVLVISHNNLKDWIANSITVSMESDISKVSGFLNVY